MRALAAGEDPHGGGPGGELVPGRALAQQGGQLTNVSFLDPALPVAAATAGAGVISAAGELYARGLLTDGQRKSMVPMAVRLGTSHQRLQQFITSSTWDYAAVRRNVARWFAARWPVDALVVY